ncbi:hypothetical protein LTR56_020448 [Elasticomyces elasticus]|nr:hypothetical protein LTR56_020448 [Elasticomyces elasticus]KAK3645818.1 hypothetical protein LTR22_014586 [Elasticomyces elasticus]KAK4910572.1 hypothetical protein LTR49_020776 [Elasticomyces elasticus]KAK5747298.1 hypothetical protein LTS12_022448 [Elasticomyces elasticus]
MAQANGEKQVESGSKNDALPGATQDAPSSRPMLRKALDGLMASVRALSVDPTLDSILERVELIPKLEEKIRQDDDRLKKLQTELEQSESSHGVILRGSLETYNIDREKNRAELDEARRQVAVLQGQLTQRETATESLKRAGASLGSKIKDLEESLKAQSDKANGASAAIQGLKVAVKANKDTNAKLESSLKQREASMAQTQVDMKRLQNANETLENRVRRAEQRLKDAESLTVPLHNEDPTQMMDKLDVLWVEASSLVCSTFFQDMSDETLRAVTWSRLENPGIWSYALPMPRSNSDAAKQMRCVVILGSLARAVAKHIFQPTYFPDCSGIRSVLTFQAQEDSRKEAAFRAMVQALLPTRQNPAASDAVARACDEVMGIIRGVLPNEEVGFRKRLQALVEEACAVWGKIRRSAFAIEPSFDLRDYPNWSWGELRFEAGQPVISEREQGAGAGQDETLFAVFPRLYISDQTGRVPEIHGVGFMKSQSTAANEEASPGLQRNDSTRIARRFRGVSTGASSSHSGLGVQPFLDRGS